MSEDYWANERYAEHAEELERLYELLKRDPGQAIVGLAALADRGSLVSMLYLAQAYMGDFLPKDLVKAKYWYSRASEIGSPGASHMLGQVCRHLGEQEEAFAAYSRSAGKGFMPSLFRLGKMYQHGVGTKKDMKKCQKLLTEAASRGHLLAKRDLAILHLRGAFGLKSIPKGLTILSDFLSDLPGCFTQAVKNGPGPVRDDRFYG